MITWTDWKWGRGNKERWNKTASEVWWGRQKNERETLNTRKKDHSKRDKRKRIAYNGKQKRLGMGRAWIQSRQLITLHRIHHLWCMLCWRWAHSMGQIQANCSCISSRMFGTSHCRGQVSIHHWGVATRIWSHSEHHYNGSTMGCGQPLLSHSWGVRGTWMSSGQQWPTLYWYAGWGTVVSVVGVVGMDLVVKGGLWPRWFAGQKKVGKNFEHNMIYFCVHESIFEDK